MKKLTTDNLVARVLAALARSVIRHRKWWIYSQYVFAALCIVYTVFNLKFDMSRNNLVGANKRYHQNFLSFRKEFPTQDDLVVVVESENPEKNRQFVERLGRRLEAETNLFKDVFYKGDLKMLGSKALLFVPEDDLKELKRMLGSYRPFIEKFSSASNLVSLFDMINTQFRTAKQEKSEQTDSMIKALPALESIVTEASASMRRPGMPPSPGVMALFNSDAKAEQEIYITYAEGTIYLITAQALTDKMNDKAVTRLRELLPEIQAEVPGVNMGLTGEPVLEQDEMGQSQKDTTLATAVSLILCALIFIYGYNETGRPLKATLSLIVGLAYTMAFTTAVVGHLNILTITFAPILIGLAIDFGVHLVTRYEEELRYGRSEEEAMMKAMVFTGQGIFTGAFTTAGAFLAMVFTNFKGIQEMGVICGGGLLICLIPMVTILPALLLKGRQNVIDHENGDKIDQRARIENIWLQRPAPVVMITIALCAIAGYLSRDLYFDYNLLNMQSKGLPAVEFEEKLINLSTNAPTAGTTNAAVRSVLFASVVADSVEEAAALHDRIKQLPTVSEVDSIAKFLAEDQTEKLRLIGEIKQEIAGIHFSDPDMKPVNASELSRTLYSTGGYLGMAEDIIRKDEPEIAKQLMSLRLSVNNLRHDLFKGSSREQEERLGKLAAFQRSLFDDIRDTFESLQNQDNREKLRVEDLPLALRHRFIGIHGKQLLQVYPKKNAWDRKYQEEFIYDLRTSLDPKGTDHPMITGTPVQLYEYTGLLRDSYQQAALYSLIAISILVFAHFRTLGSVVLALLPVAIGSIWLAGIMGFFDIPLNPANIMTLPLVIGIGVTNGIHILNRFAEEQTPSILAKSTGKAVLVSGLTTIAGFGSLALAKHRGIESLGYVMATGVAMCMIAGLTFLPALLNLLLRRKPNMKQPSADNARSTLGREEPR